MRIRTITLAALVASTALAVGCTKGSSGSRATTTAGAVGNISSALPTPTRAAAYQVTPFFSPLSVPGGSVSAMATAPVGTGTGILVADAPFSNINAVSSGSNTFEAKLYFDANSFAAVTSGSNVTMFAATSNKNAPGAGDVWARDGSGGWQLVLDTPDNEAVVATVGSDLYVAHGSIDGNTTVQWRDGQGNFTSIATIDTARPTAATAFKGELWIGASDSDAEGGQASLYHGSGTTFNQIKMPVAIVGGNVYQRVTSLMSISSVNSGVTVDLLAIAVGEFDINGQAISGTVLISNGTEFEAVVRYSDGEAPMALAWADSTIYVGTSKGRLQYRDAAGEMIDDGVLANNGIKSLLVDGGDLYIGAAGATGAEVFLRTGGTGTPPPPPPTPTNLYFDTDIAPLLATDCASCHNGGIPAAQAAYSLASPADNAADHTETVTKVNMTTADASLLLTKAANDSTTPHVGGEVWAATSAKFNTVKTWIEQGAPLTNAPAPVKSTFAADVHQMLQSDCMTACHVNNLGGFEVTANLDSTYASAVGKVNMTTPELSDLLRRPALDGVTHPAGAIPGYTKGAAKYNILLKWINDGLLKQ